MPSDAFTLRYVAEELNGELTGGKVNKIVQPDDEEVAFYVYAGGKTKRVLFSTNATFCRVSLSSAERESPLTAPAFCMLLRKYLTGAEITGVRLLSGERIIAFSFESKNEFFACKTLCFYAELMGKYSNLVLVKDGLVLGSIKAFNLGINSLRPLLAGARYTLPPKQDKRGWDEDALAPFFETDYAGERTEDGLKDYLFNGVAGLSKPTAGELARRISLALSDAGLTLSDSGAIKIANDVFTAFFEEKKRPCVLKKEDGSPLDFYAFPYGTDEKNTVFYDGVLTAQEAYYGEKDRARILENARRTLYSVVKAKESKLKKRAKILEESEKSAKDLQREKEYGDLILQNLYRLHAGDESLTVPYAGEKEETLVIPLDKTRTPSKNAEAYFKRYQKKKRTLSAMFEQKKLLESESAYVSSLGALLSEADGLPALKAVEEELALAGFIKSQKKKAKTKKTVGISYFLDGYTVKVGRNNYENDELTFSATGNSLWLHVYGYHSAHVLILTNDDEIPERIIKTAAEICAYYSEARGGDKVQVDYVKKKFVKKPQGAAAGFVTYHGQHSLVVRADKHENDLTR